MNVVNSENHSNFLVNKFVARLIQTATCDLHMRAKPSAHDLAMAYQAAFAARKASK